MFLRTLSLVSIFSIALQLQFSYFASSAPLPPIISTQPQHSFNGTFFPYKVQGPTPPPLYKPGRVLNTCTLSNSYAISFDDGPGQLTDELLDYLDEQRIKVTFFMNGDNWHCIYQPERQRLLKRAYKAQHQIAAHPWSHRDLEGLSDKDIRQEMHKIEQAFRQILGVVPRYMRPPYGEHSRRVRRVLEELGYILVLWDVDHKSHHHMSTATSEEVTRLSQSTSQKPMVGSGHHHHHHQSKDEGFDLNGFTSKWAEAVRGVPSTPLDREAMSLSGIYQEVTSEWAVEYVQSLGMKITTVGRCLGEEDSRLWYKEVGPPSPSESTPTSCYAN